MSHSQGHVTESLAQVSGLRWPAAGRIRWVLDPHFALAVAAALPIWALLGFFVGRDMQAPPPWTPWLSLVFVQPIAEELVFRGVLQGQFLRLSRGLRLGPVSAGNLVTTAAFCLLHLVAQPPAWALAVAAPSLVFGHMRERFHSVWPACTLHAIYNAGFGITAWLAR